MQIHPCLAKLQKSIEKAGSGVFSLFQKFKDTRQNQAKICKISHYQKQILTHLDTNILQIRSLLAKFPSRLEIFHCVLHTMTFRQSPLGNELELQQEQSRLTNSVAKKPGLNEVISFSKWPKTTLRYVEEKWPSGEFYFIFKIIEQVLHCV